MNKENRIATIQDEKQQIVDLPATTLIPPATGIYEGELRYYAASKEWQILIEGWVSWLTELSAWQLADSEDYQAIQEISTFLQGVEIQTIPEGAIVTTPQELEDAVCKGVICALEEVSSRVLLAQNGNIELPIRIATDTSNGEPRIAIDDTASDTSTITASKDEITFGGAYGMGNGFQKLMKFITDELVFGQTPSDIADLVIEFWDVTTGLEQSLVGGITDYSGVTNPPAVDAESIALAVWCDGKSRSALSRWAFDRSRFYTIDSPNANLATMYSAYQKIINVLTEQQVSEWYTAGLDVPRTGYELASCYLPPTYEFTWTADELIASTSREIEVQPPVPNGRKYRLEFQGEIVNSLGHKWNGAYAEDAGGVYRGAALYMKATNNVNTHPQQPIINRYGAKNAVEFHLAPNTTGIFAFLSNNNTVVSAFASNTPLTGQIDFKLIAIE